MTHATFQQKKWPMNDVSTKKSISYRLTQWLPILCSTNTDIIIQDYADNNVLH